MAKHYFHANRVTGVQFHIVDVFSADPYAGNQLAVIESERRLDAEAMQAIAAEMNYSETTFIESFETFDVRIFTPSDEIPFAGHPTLGTASVIRDRTDAVEPTLSLPVGSVPVHVESTPAGDVLWMTQQPPTMGETIDRSQAAESIGVDAEHIDGPVQVVSTGLPTIIVPVADREILEAATIDDDAYTALVQSRDAKNVLVYCDSPRSAANDFAVRVFAPALGVPEDPATGSSNGCLGAYLHDQRGEPIDARIEQGESMGRPSLLYIRADDDGVQVGGSVSRVATGSLSLPNQNG